MLTTTAPTIAGYGAITIDLGKTKLTAVQDGMKDATDICGIPYTSYDVIRETANRRQRIANVTIYASGDALVLYGLGSKPNMGDFTARDRLRKHLAATYNILGHSIAEYRLPAFA